MSPTDTHTTIAPDPAPADADRPRARLIIAGRRGTSAKALTEEKEEISRVLSAERSIAARLAERLAAKLAQAGRGPTEQDVLDLVSDYHAEVRRAFGRSVICAGRIEGPAVRS